MTRIDFDGISGFLFWLVFYCKLLVSPGIKTALYKHYFVFVAMNIYLPMETLYHNSVFLEDGLVANARFGVRTAPGLLGQAILFDFPTSGLNFGNMRNSCLGNLDLCPSGFTMRFLVKMGLANKEEFYVSSGGDDIVTSMGIVIARSHGFLFVS